MNYSETLDFLYSQLPMYQRTGKAAYKNNLDNTQALDRHFKHPHKAYKTIHVAGTNGKGSTSHMLASILQEAGYKVGLYTSPHLKDFRERIRINGKMIPENEVIEFIGGTQDLIKTIQPSFFELTVAMAFTYFKKENIDIAVIEVGLGGRLDSTNIISPELSVITNIGMDHTELLGDNLEKIAKEKAGIIKPEIPVIIGEKQTKIKQIFIDRANELSSPICFAQDEYSADYSMESIDGFQLFNIKKDDSIYYDNLKVNLLGKYQRKNLITVLAAIDIAIKKGFKIEKTHIYNGLQNIVKNTGLKGRWQILKQNPLVVCDTGHNKEGLREVITQINNTAYKSLHIILGVVNDKNIEALLELMPKEANYYFTKASIPRALDEHILFEQAKNYNLKGVTYPTTKDAYEAALESADINDMIFIGGSTFIVAEVV